MGVCLSCERSTQVDGECQSKNILALYVYFIKDFFPQITNQRVKRVLLYYVCTTPSDKNGYTSSIHAYGKRHMSMTVVTEDLGMVPR